MAQLCHSHMAGLCISSVSFRTMHVLYTAVMIHVSVCVTRIGAFCHDLTGLPGLPGLTGLPGLAG
jgi:hypothetical protein